MQTAEAIESVGRVFTDVAEQQTHVARCEECPGDMTFRPTSSGNGFMILAINGFDSEATFSVGDNGRPVCPNGHGEMALADEQLPSAHDAITEAAQRLQGAKQASLPGVFPAFNYQGAYLELEAQAERVARLKETAKEDAETARESKKAWEKAAELLTTMALQFEQRRREKSEPPTSEQSENAGGSIVPCLFEQRHPQVPCPLCAGTSEMFDSSQIFGRDTESHVVQALAEIESQACNEVSERLEEIANMRVAQTIVRGWTEDERAAVVAWLDASENGAEPQPPRPAALGTMHVAGKITEEGEDQTCTQCDQILIAGSDANYYEEGTLVGTDCKGQPARHLKSTRGGKKKGGRK